MSQQAFVAVVKKTFFQPGSGRQENALTRGFGRSDAKKAFERVVKYLVSKGILGVVKGDSGRLFIPVREHTRRLEAIISKLTQSDDPLWKEIPGD